MARSRLEWNDRSIKFKHQSSILFKTEMDNKVCGCDPFTVCSQAIPDVDQDAGITADAEPAEAEVVMAMSS